MTATRRPGWLEFALVMPPAQPEGLILLIRHLTPEALWRLPFLDHPNHVVGLAELLVMVAEPAETAARFSRLSGRPVLPDPAGGFALDLPRGRVRILPDDAVSSLLPGVAVPDPPCIAGITLHTDDDNVALRDRLDQCGEAYRITGPALVTAVGGVGLRFVSAA